MRAWLLTTTTYGTWLPGDPRGSVTSVRDRRTYDPISDTRIEHDHYGEEYEPAILGLYRAACEQLKGPLIYLNLEMAEVVFGQLCETMSFRSWNLHALSIMCNHWHMVARVPGDPDPDKVLADLKAYASRALNKRYGVPASETWWTEKGSARKLPNQRALRAATHYVLYKQPNPLIVWSAEEGRLV